MVFKKVKISIYKRSIGNSDLNFEILIAAEEISVETIKLGEAWQYLSDSLVVGASERLSKGPGFKSGHFSHPVTFCGTV